MCHYVCGYAKAGIRNSSGAGGLGHRITVKLLRKNQIAWEVMNIGPENAKPIIAGLPLHSPQLPRTRRGTAICPNKFREQDQLVFETKHLRVELELILYMRC